MKAKYLGLAILLGGRGGCVVHPPQTSEPPASLPPQSQPQPGPSSAPGATPPRITPQPQTPAQPSRSRPQFAPPPGGKGVWDGSLGVYVIRGERDLYYRQRTYYRWDGGWFWSTSPQGPWTETDARGIPPGLSRRYANP
ncbi:hypothetical protein I5F54_19235 [Pseudomonas aeruginosa]|nr:hypothetical protein [Pseudomonas aeruginosa]